MLVPGEFSPEGIPKGETRGVDVDTQQPLEPVEEAEVVEFEEVFEVALVLRLPDLLSLEASVLAPP